MSTVILRSCHSLIHDQWESDNEFDHCNPEYCTYYSQININYLYILYFMVSGMNMAVELIKSVIGKVFTIYHDTAAGTSHLSSKPSASNIISFHIYCILF